MATLVVFGLLLAVPDVSPRVGIGFRIAQAVFLLGFLLRDAGGASPGKRLFGLKTGIFPGRGPLLASVARNLPLIVPGWNLLEALAVLREDQRRPGDRLAGTFVAEA